MKFIREQYTEDYIGNVIHINDKVVYATLDNMSVIMLLHQGTVVSIPYPKAVYIMPKYQFNPHRSYPLLIKTCNVVRQEW